MERQIQVEQGRMEEKKQEFNRLMDGIKKSFVTFGEPSQSLKHNYQTNDEIMSNSAFDSAIQKTSNLLSNISVYNNLSFAQEE